MTSHQPSVQRRVESIAPQHCHGVAAALADAFVDDPVMGWLLPDHRRRPTALRRFFAIETRDVALRHPDSLVALEPERAVAAALVLPPGHWRLPIGVQARHAVDYARIFGRRTGHAAGLLTALEARHPRYPHHYLAVIGVESAAQGQGVGAALLTAMLRRCDHEALPAYLEASSPDNARLYRRHGFVTTETVRPLGSPPIELMIRQPAVTT